MGFQSLGAPFSRPGIRRGRRASGRGRGQRSGAFVWVRITVAHATGTPSPARPGGVEWGGEPRPASPRPLPSGRRRKSFCQRGSRTYGSHLRSQGAPHGRGRGGAGPCLRGGRPPPGSTPRKSDVGGSSVWDSTPLGGGGCRRRLRDPTESGEGAGFGSGEGGAAPSLPPPPPAGARLAAAAPPSSSRSDAGGGWGAPPCDAPSSPCPSAAAAVPGAPHGPGQPERAPPLTASLPARTPAPGR